MLKLDVEQKILLDLIKASLFQIEVTFPESTDWDRVYKLASEQQIIALTASAVPADYKGKWFEALTQCVYHSVRLLHEQEELLKLFQENAIPVAIVKGTAAAIYYPDPAVRTMGDIDFLVKKDSYEDAKKLLLENKYIYHKENHRHCEYEKNGIEFELHRKMSFQGGTEFDHILVDGKLDVVEYKINNSVFYGLSTYKNGLVLLGHIMQHLKNSGIGLRQIIDWMMFVQAELFDDAWEKEFKPYAQEAGLEKLAITITFMCKKWLGLSGEITWCDVADEALADEILMRLFIDGNFGHERPQTEKIQIQIRKKGVFSYLQYAGMKNWKLAQKHKILQPFAWLYQICRYIQKGIVDLLGEKTILQNKRTSMSIEEIWKKLE